MVPMKSFEEKKAYYNRVKLDNYRASMKLEGQGKTPLNIDLIPSMQEERNKLKEQILKRVLFG